MLVLLEIQSEAEPSVKLAVLQAEAQPKRHGCLAVRLGVVGSGIAVLNQHLNAATIRAAHEHNH